VRVIIYDRTCRLRGRGLSPVWAVGARLYRGFGRSDAVFGAASWGEALAFVASRPEPVREVQYWGHGKWGGARIDRESLDAGALVAGHPLHAALEATRDRLAPDALVWFRTCETFGARPGIDFAERLADFLGARVAGHTYIVAYHQSGLHGLHPGTRADWSPYEGLAEGSPEAPARAQWSRRYAPRTVSCLDGEVPEAWYAPAKNRS
jgi:hypothetical protein